MHVDAHTVSRSRIAANGADTQAELSAAEQKRRYGHQCPGEVDQRRLLKKYRTDPGEVGQEGNVQRGQRVDLRRQRVLAIQQAVDVTSDTEAKNVEDHPGDA